MVGGHVWRTGRAHNLMIKSQVFRGSMPLGCDFQKGFLVTTQSKWHKKTKGAVGGEIPLQLG